MSKPFTELGPINKDRVRRARMKLRISQKALAALVEVGRLAIARIESGETKHPEEQTVIGLSRELGKPVEFFFQWEPLEVDQAQSSEEQMTSANGAKKSKQRGTEATSDQRTATYSASKDVNGSVASKAIESNLGISRSHDLAQSVQTLSKLADTLKGKLKAEVVREILATNKELRGFKGD